jgi:hypothetical protein
MNGVRPEVPVGDEIAPEVLNVGHELLYRVTRGTPGRAAGARPPLVQRGEQTTGLTYPLRVDLPIATIPPYETFKHFNIIFEKLVCPHPFIL